MNAIWERLETWFFVTVVTLLVWVYAEGENVKPHDLDVTVRPVAEAGAELWIAPDTPTKVQLTVRCSQSQLTQLKAAARNPFDLPLTADPENPTQALTVKDLLANMEPFADLGVNILDAEPARVSFNVEAMQTATVEVRVILPEDVQLAPGLVVEPARAVVQVPSRFLTLIEANKLEARLDLERLEDIDDNVAQSLDVPLTLPGSVQPPQFKITPASVRITFTVRKQTDTFTVPSVPVVIALSPILTQRYDVTVSPEQLFVRDLKIAGPRDAVQKIRDGEIKVRAEILLSSDDLEAKVESIVPTIDLPSGVTLASQVPRINLTIRPRSDTVLSPPSP